MFTIKKFISIFLVIAIALSMCACQKSDATGNTNTDNAGQTETQPTQEPAKDYNALTGEKLSDTTQIHSRPVAVMINNAKVALPQSGLSDADIIYEMVTEGGVTRLMAVYNDISEISGRVGPVRSARDQFIEFMMPLNAIYVHIGTSTSAKRMLNFYSYQDIDGIYLGFLSFNFDSELAKTKSSEHCWYTDASLIKAGIDANGITTESKGFYPAFNYVGYDDEKYVIEETETNAAMQMDFSYSDYRDVSFVYNTETGKYFKSAFGAPHIDADTGEQLAFENVLVLLCDIGIESDNGILPEFYLDEGIGYYFNGGRYQTVTWSKAEPEDPLVIRDERGELLSINTGKTYLGVLDSARRGTICLTDEEGTVTEGIVRVQ